MITDNEVDNRGTGTAKKYGGGWYPFLFAINKDKEVK